MTLKPCEQNEHGYHNFTVVKWKGKIGNFATDYTYLKAEEMKCSHCLLTPEEVRKG